MGAILWKFKSSLAHQVELTDIKAFDYNAFSFYRFSNLPPNKKDTFDTIQYLACLYALYYTPDLLNFNYLLGFGGY